MENFTDFFDDSYLPLLKSRQLFSRLDDGEIRRFINYAKPLYVSVKQGESMRITPETAKMVGVLISGAADFSRIESNGSKAILMRLDSNDSTAPPFYFFDYEATFIEVQAAQPLEALLFAPQALYEPAPELLDIQQKIAVNMIYIQYSLFRKVNDHLLCLVQRTVRDKLLTLLHIHSMRFGSKEFDAPMNREQTAEFLAVDRASLSRTLSELKKEGVIEVHGRHYKLNY